MVQDKQNVSIIILDDDVENNMKAYVKRLNKELPEATVEHLTRVGDFLKKADVYSPDLILLDIKGMDYHPADAIQAIRERWIKLPIILFTNIFNQRDALHLRRLGAHDYFIKSDFGSTKISAFSHSADRTIEAWKRLVGRIGEAVDKYQSVKRILSDNRIIGTFEKKRGDSDLAAFRGQVGFLRLVERSEDIGVRDLFPPLSEASDVRYVIPRYRAKPLRQILFDTVWQADIEQAARVVLQPVLKTLKEGLFNRKLETLRQEKQEWFIELFYLEKLQSRIKGALASIAQAKQVTLYQRQALTDLLTAERLLVDGEPMESPVEILKSLLGDKDKRDRLLPKKIGSIHGDLHFGNILVDLTVREKPFIKLIDPGGYLEGADFAFDVGKVLHSCHGQYDMIDDGYLNTEDAMLRLDKDKDGTVIAYLPTRKDYVERDEKGRSEATGVSRLRLVTEEHFNAYESIHTWLVKYLDSEILSDDPEWQRRAYLNEALHFCRMGPAKEYLKDDPTKLYALYITGVRLMNEVKSKFN